MAEARNCPDCQQPMHPIRLIDATQATEFGTHGAGHVDLQYALPDAHLKTGWKSTYIPSAGKIGAAVCPECGRIVLHAVPNA